MAEPLTDDDLVILELERRRWRFPGAKDTVIMDMLGISRTRYDQRLLALLDKPEALELDPVLVRRLQRLRDQRRAARSPRAV